MTSSIAALLTVLGRWPRRLAALACLVLAAGAAVPGRHAPAQPATAPSPGPSQSAVPVPVTGIDARAYLHVGDLVDLLAAPPEVRSTGPPVAATVVAQGVRVLSIVAADASVGGGGSSTLIVAADRPTALRIAALAGNPVLAVRDGPA